MSQGLSRNSNTESFGERVRRYRLASGMTQQQLAATVGRGHSMISGIESGARQIHVDELVTFADALRVPAAALLGNSDGDLYRRGFTAGWAAAMAQARDFAARSMFEPDAQSRPHT